jgi:hypothetical protein
MLVVPPELLRTLPDWHALVVRMNLSSPAVVRIRPVWKRPESRFPLRHLHAQPRLPAFPACRLPLPEVVGFAEVPEIGPSAPVHPDLVSVPGPQEPWKWNGTGGAMTDRRQERAAPNWMSSRGDKSHG